MGDADRASMMKELFNLGRYDLSDKASQLAAVTKEKKLLCQGRLDGLSEVSAEKLGDLRIAVDTIGETLATQTALLEQATIAEKDQSDLQQKFEQLQQYQANLDAHELRRREMDAKRLGLQQFIHYQKIFSPLLSAQRDLKDKQKNLHVEIDQKSSSLKALESQIATLAIQLQHNEEEQLKIPSHQKQLEVLPKMKEVRILDEALQALNKRFANGKGKMATNQQQHDEVELAIKSLQTALQQLKTEYVDLSVFNAEKIEIIRIQAYFDKVKMAQAHLEKLKESLGQLLAKQQQNWSTVLPGTDFQSDAAQEEFVQNQLAERQAALGMAKRTLEQLRLAKDLWQYRQNLSNGEACPVCGSTEHHLEDLVEHDESHWAALNAEISKQEKEIRAIELFQPHAAELRQRIQTVTGEVQSAKEDLERLNANHPDPSKRTEQVLAERLAVLDKALQKAQLQATERAKMEEEIDKRQLTLQEVVAERARFESLLKAIETEQAQVEGSLRIYGAQIPKELTERMGPLTLLELEDLERQSHSFLETTTAERNRLDKAKLDLDLQQASLAAVVDTLTTQQKDLAAELELVVEALSKALVRDQVAEVEVLSVLQHPLDEAAVQAELDGHQRKGIELRTKVESAVAEIAGRQYDLVLHQQLKVDVAAQANQLNETKIKSGELTYRYAQLQSDLVEKQKLVVEFDTLDTRLQNIGILVNLFKGNGFVNFVSTSYLQNLCEVANERFFKMTQQKLKLELSDSNNFIIRDYFNNGETRSVRTLSGGQKFQAALCLALALADNVGQATHAEQNFFFLDEGFGSLDKDSLEMVFNTLKSLQLERRIVGVISHVDEMQQEIETNLLIRNTLERGSVVEESWARRVVTT